MVIDLKKTARLFASVAVIFVAPLVGAERLNLSCVAAEAFVQPELHYPLKQGEVRAIDAGLAAFVNSDEFSTTLTTECEGRGENKRCLQIADANYCPKPAPTFRIRSVSDDNDVIMIKNRCFGKWVKHKKISEKDGTLNFLDDTVAFQLKNQVHSGISVLDKPIIRIGSLIEGSAAFTIESFSRDLWMINEYDPLVGRLKVETETYEPDPHNKVLLTSVCTPAR